MAKGEGRDGTPPWPAGNDGSNQLPWYGARPWPRGDHLQRDQMAPVKIIGALILAVIAVLVVVALLNG